MITKETEPTLRRGSHGETLPRSASSTMALAQVGWLGQTGHVYALADPPRDGREPGGYSPIYIQLGIWEDLGDGRFAVRD